MTVGTASDNSCYPWYCAYGLVSIHGWPLNTGKNNKDKHGTATGWPRPLNRGGRLIQVTNTAFVCAKNRDFKNWPLNRGWPLNTGLLYTGSTVTCIG